ncbi:hypothetical protein ACFL52_04105 [Candidatus Margulisiibacteriota bacterium]
MSPPIVSPPIDTASITANPSDDKRLASAEFFTTALTSFSKERDSTGLKYFIIQLLYRGADFRLDDHIVAAQINNPTRKDWKGFILLLNALYDNGQIDYQQTFNIIRSSIKGTGGFELLIDLGYHIKHGRIPIKDNPIVHAARGEHFGNSPTHMLIEEIGRGFICDRNDQTLLDYLEKNGSIITAKILESLINKRIITDIDDPIIEKNLSYLSENPNEWNDRDYREMVAILTKTGLIKDRHDQKLAYAFQTVEKKEALFKKIAFSELVNSMMEGRIITQADDPLLIKAVGRYNIADCKNEGSKFYAYMKFLLARANCGLIEPETFHNEVARLIKVSGNDGFLETGSIAEQVDDYVNQNYPDQVASGLFDAGYGFRAKVRSKCRKSIETASKKYPFDVDSLNFQLAQAKSLDLDPLYYLQQEILRIKIGISEKDITEMRKCSHEYLSRIDNQNQKAVREDQKINLVTIGLTCIHGMINLQAISASLTKELVCGVCQRGFLRILHHEFKTAAKLTPEQVKVLRNYFKSQKKQLNPSFMIQIINFAIALEQSGYTPEEFNRILNSGPPEYAIRKIATKLIIFLIRKLGIDQDNNIDQLIDNILSNWNVVHLGSMIVAASEWSGQLKRLFNLILRTAIEGKFHALLFPSEHPTTDFNAYAAEENGLVEKIQEYNRLLIQEAIELGVDTRLWAHPESFPVKPLAAGSVDRYWKDLLFDLQTRLNDFDRWQEHSELTSNCIFQEQYELALLSLGPLGLLLKKNGKSVRMTKGLLKNKENLTSLSKFLKEIARKFTDQASTPDPINKLISIINEVLYYNLDAPSQSRQSRQARFWRRDVGRDAVLGNQVNSCLRLDGHSHGIYEFLVDLGTMNMIIENPETKEEKGYVRFYLASNTMGKPAIIIDNADGEASEGNWQPKEFAVNYIKDFAAASGIDPANVNTRGKFKEKVGGTLTNLYFQFHKIKFPFKIKLDAPDK